jgi:hypothetical protein
VRLLPRAWAARARRAGCGPIWAELGKAGPSYFSLLVFVLFLKFCAISYAIYIMS